MFLILFTIKPNLDSTYDFMLQLEEKENPFPTNLNKSMKSVNTIIHIDNTTTIDWIKSHQKPDGGYGRLDNPWSHISWTYPALHGLNILDKSRSDNYAQPSNVIQTINWLHDLEGDGPNNSFDDNNDRKGNSLSSNTPHSDFEGINSLLQLNTTLNNKQESINYLSNLQLIYSGIYQSGDLRDVLHVAWALDLLGEADQANRNNIV